MFLSILLGLKKSSEDCISRPLAEIFGLHTASVLTALDRRFYALAKADSSARWMRIQIKQLSQDCLISDDTCSKVLMILEECGIIQRKQTDINTYQFCLFTERFKEIKQIVESSEFPKKTWDIFQSRLRFKLIGDSSGKGRRYSEIVIKSCEPYITELFRLIGTKSDYGVLLQSGYINSDILKTPETDSTVSVADNKVSVTNTACSVPQIAEPETATPITYNKDPYKVLNKNKLLSLSLKENLSELRNLSKPEREKEDISCNLNSEEKQEKEDLTDFSYLGDKEENQAECNKPCIEKNIPAAATSTNVSDSTLRAFKPPRKNIWGDYTFDRYQTPYKGINVSEIWFSKDEMIAFDSELLKYAQKRSRTNAFAYKLKIFKSVCESGEHGLVHPLLQEFRDGLTLGSSDLKPWQQEDGKLDAGFYAWLKRKYSENHRDGSIAIDRLNATQLSQKWDEYKNAVLREIESAQKLKALGVGYVSLSADVLPELQPPTDREFEVLRAGSGYFPEALPAQNQKTMTDLVTNSDNLVKALQPAPVNVFSEVVGEVDCFDHGEPDQDSCKSDPKTGEFDQFIEAELIPSQKSKSTSIASLFSSISEKLGMTSGNRQGNTTDDVILESLAGNSVIDQINYKTPIVNFPEDYCDEILGF